MFKNLRIFFICSMLSFGLAAQDDERSMAVSLSPLGIVGGSINGLFQYNLASFVSLTLPAHFSYSWGYSLLLGMLSSKSQKYSTSIAPISYGGGLGARFYPTGKGMNDGFYLEPRLTVNYSQFGAEAQGLGKLEWARTNLSPMLHLGWDWFFNSGFYMNLGGGIGYSYNLKSEGYVSHQIKETLGKYADALVQNESKHHFAWDLEFKLGWAW